MNNERCVVKLKLNKILKNGTDYTKFYESINNSNKLVNIGYLFMRLFIMHTINNNRQYVPM